MLNFDIISQAGIAVFGVTAIFLANIHNVAWRRWAPIVGMCSQPFWFYTTFHHEQWGMFGLVFLYTGSWGLGIYNHWIKKEKK